MRSINFRFVGISLLCVLLICGAVHAVHVMQFDGHVDFLRQMAQQADDSGDSSRAIGHYRRYVTLSRTDAEAYERLGDLLIEARVFQQARSPLERALILREEEGAEAEELDAIRSKLVDIDLYTGRYSDAEDRINGLLESDPGNVELKEKRAASYEGQEKWGEAARELKDVIGEDSGRVRAYGQLARIAAENLDNSALAVESLRKMVERNPESALALLIRSDFRRRHVTDPEDDVRLAEARADAKSDAQRVEPLTQDELLDRATEDANRAVKLVDSQPVANAGVDASAEERRKKIEEHEVLQVSCIALAMGCEQQPRRSSSAETFAERRRKAVDYARKLIAICEKNFARREAAATAVLRQRAKKEAQDKGRELSEEELGKASTLAADVRTRMERAAFLPAAQAYIILSVDQRESGDLAEAIKTLNGGLEKTGIEPGMLWQLGKLHLSAGEDEFDDDAFASVRARLSEIRQPKPAKPLADLLEGQRLIGQGQYEDARTLIDSLRGQLSLWPETLVEADTSLGQCYQATGRPQEAETAYRRALNGNSSAKLARQGLAQVLVLLGKQDEAIEEYQLLTEDFGNLTNSELGPELLIRRFQLEAARLLETSAGDEQWDKLTSDVRAHRAEIVAQAGDDKELVRLADELGGLEARIMFNRGRHQEALEMLTAEAQRAPQSIGLWTLLVEIYDRLGNHGAAQVALGSLQQAVEAPTPEEELAIQLAVAGHAVSAQGEDAGGELLKMIEACGKAPDDAPTRRTHVQLLLSLGGWARFIGDYPTAIKAFEKVNAAEPDNVIAIVNRIDLLRSTVATPEETTVEELRSQWTEKLEELRTLVDRIDEKSSRGTRAARHYGNAVSHIISAELKKSALSPDEEDAGAGEYKLALEELTSAAQQAPRWSQIAYLQGLVLLNQGKESLAADAWKRAFALGHRDPRFVSGLVMLLYKTGRYDEAAQLLVEIQADQAPQFMQIAQTAASLSTMSSALGNDERLQKQLLELAVKSAAKTAEQSSDPAHHLAYAEILLMHGDVQAAVQALQHVRELSPTDRASWLKQIQLYRQLTRRGQMPEDQAKQSIQESLSAAEAVLSAEDMSVVASQTLWDLGERDEARVRIRDALKELPEDLHQATASQIEMMSRAIEYFLFDANGTADEETRTLGEQLLHRLIDDGSQVISDLQSARASARGTTQASPLEVVLSQHVPLARRRLATIVLAREGNAGRSEALELLAKNKPASGNPRMDDERLRAVILSRSTDRKDRDAAIDLLKALVQPNLQQPVRNEDRMLLATLSLAEYERQQQRLTLLRKNHSPDAASNDAIRAIEIEVGDLLKTAREQTDQIVGSSSPTVGNQVDNGYLTALMLQIDILLRSEDYAAAQISLNQLKKLNPGAKATALTEASVQFAVGRHDEVIPLLKGLVSADEEEKRMAELSSTAKLLEQMGARARVMANDDDADADMLRAAADKYMNAVQEILEPLAKQGPDQQLALAGFYARQDRTDDALRLLEAHWESASVAALAASASQLMGSRGRTESSMERLHSVLKAAYDRDPQELALRLLLADLSGWMGNYTEAERLYREVLNDSPNHVVAANNLAYLLASQEKQLDEAFDLIEGVIAARGRVPELLDTRAYVLLQRSSARNEVRDAKTAIADLAAAIYESPQPAYLYHLARANLIAGESKVAKIEWERAKQASLTEETLHPAELDEFRSFKAQIDSL